MDQWITSSQQSSGLTRGSPIPLLLLWHLLAIQLNTPSSDLRLLHAHDLGCVSMSAPHSRIHTAVRACYVHVTCLRHLPVAYWQSPPTPDKCHAIPDVPTNPLLSLPHFWPRIPVSNSDPGFRWRRGAGTSLCVFLSQPPAPRTSSSTHVPPLCSFCCPQPIGCFPL